MKPTLTYWLRYFRRVHRIALMRRLEMAVEYGALTHQQACASFAREVPVSWLWRVGDWEARLCQARRTYVSRVGSRDNQTWEREP